MKTDVQAICLDLFNTLVDVATVPESVGRFTADILKIDRNVWREACFGPAHVIREPVDPYLNLLSLAKSIEPEISATLVKEAVAERQARFDYALIHVEQNILETLTQLKQKGVKTALISNASSSEIEAWQRSPLSELFDVVTFSCYCGYVKPESNIYESTLECLNIDAESSLFIGDGGSDEHFGAHNVGMRPVLTTQFMNRKESKRREEKYGEVLIGKVSELKGLLESGWLN